MRSYGIARNTAREAVRLLAAQGLVTAEHGRGVFVRAKPRLLRFGQRRYARALREETGRSPFRAEVEAQGRTPSVNCTSTGEVAPPGDVADRLGLDPAHDKVIRRENWYFADDEPLQVGVTYIPLPVAGKSVLATSANLGPGSLYARFEERGHPITEIREEVTARVPDPQEARELQIPDGVPVLDVLHNGLDYTMPVQDQ
jgi:GntR family transcriptional regulator